MRRISHRNLGVSPGGYRSRFGTIGVEHRKARPAPEYAIEPEPASAFEPESVA
jgi:hypothetical protein